MEIGDILQKLIFVCPLLFGAGVIDGICGGGGIIALPTYILAGLPLNAAYGCNKMQSCLGTSASLFKYAKSNLVDAKAALFSAVGAVAGSQMSTRLMLGFNDSVKKIIIAVAMGAVILLLILMSRIKTDAGDVTRLNLNSKSIIICLVIGLVLGLYDGFFGPGGGTVAIMLFTLIFRYDMRVGSGNGKLVIVVSNLIALVNYIVEGSVVYAIAVPATVANICGSYLGASLATKKGAGVIGKILPLVAAAVVVQAIIDIIK